MHVVASIEASVRSNPAVHPVELTVICFALALLCFIPAWDGCVRGRISLPFFPSVGGVWARLVGIPAALLDGLLVFLAWQSWREESTLCSGSWACIGTHVRTIDSSTWSVLAGALLFWVVVWLRIGDPRKRILLYGVWYHQEHAARAVRRQLRAQQLPLLTGEQIYTLEDEVVRLMGKEGWLERAADKTAQEVPLDEMYQFVMRRHRYRNATEAERVALHALLDYFITRARTVRHMLPLVRWWIGSGQIGKMMTYGRRDL